MPVVVLFPLCACAFLAGVVDAVAGGGGLVQLPALFVFWPGAAPATALGTNKLASFCGTAFALRQYAARVRIDWPVVGAAAAIAFVTSFLGARAVTHVSSSSLRPLVLAVLILVAIYTFIRKDFGTIHAPRLTGRRQTLTALGMGALIGFYDGFLGPGTGSFLVFGFIGLFGYDFLVASASAKLVNVATNLSALLYFGATGHVAWMVASPMAVCNIIGALVGARLAMTRGNRFVRALFLAVVALVLLKFAHDTFFPGPSRLSPPRHAVRQRMQ